MSFHDQLEVDRDRAFLSATEFGETVVRLVEGRSDDRRHIVAIVDWDDESETKSLGQVRTFDDKGRRLPAFVRLEVAADQAIADDDRYLVARAGQDVIVNFVRVLESDATMKTLLCKDPGSRTTKRTRVRS